ncbi:MAG: glycosyltransferase family 2 protein [Microthrixaceae bacterium]
MRKFGTDRDFTPLPAVAAPPSRRAVSGARFAIVLTLAAWIAYAIDQFYRIGQNPISVRTVLDTFTYFVLVTLLTASAVAYLLTRLGYLYRIRDHQRIPRTAIDDFYSEHMPTLTAIIPSFKEDYRVIRQTLLSAALQEYPYMRIVLLIDDPPYPTDPADIERLQAARDLPEEIQNLLGKLRKRFEDALHKFETTQLLSDQDYFDHQRKLSTLYEVAADWLHGEAASQELVDNSDIFMANSVLDGLANELTEVALALQLASSEGARLGDDRLLQLHRRLAWTFRTDLSSFERKQYSSLSREVNKAMNLNSYIGLMGRRFRTETLPSGPVLIEVRGEAFDFEVPDPDYVLTLDADSTLLPEYCLRLVYLMEQQGYRDVAVAQTPYSAYPGAQTRVQRISGATTDLQHIVHQGLTKDNATFWVGANAVLRKVALNDLCEMDTEDGLIIRRYIQDRTPIEDTESSIDICAHGWRLFNFPERLSYSATPEDFGSLCVQRQRWANGGLIVLPKFRDLMKKRYSQVGLKAAREGFLRLNYLASITWASLGLIMLLVYPYDNRLVSPIALLAAIPYFVAMSSDLKRCGYKRTDVFRVYGFNLLLLPVNIAGVVKSLEQSIGGQKIPFARTPKVRDRTRAALPFVAIPFLIVGLSSWTLYQDLQQNHLNHAVFAGSNAVLTMYAIIAFVGFRYSLSDIRYGLAKKLYKPEKPQEQEQEPDWASVLYFGSGSTEQPSGVAPLVATLALLDREGDEVNLLVQADTQSLDKAQVNGSEQDKTFKRPGILKRMLSSKHRAQYRNNRSGRSNTSARSNSGSQSLVESSALYSDDPAEALLATLARYAGNGGSGVTVTVEDGKMSIVLDVSESLGNASPNTSVTTTVGTSASDRRQKVGPPPMGIERRAPSTIDLTL